MNFFEKKQFSDYYSGDRFRIITDVMLFFWFLFQFWFSTFGIISAINLRAFHCLFLSVFSFVFFPAVRKKKDLRKLPSVFDYILILVSVFTFCSLVVLYNRIAQSGGRIGLFEIIVACAGILVVFEASRRVSFNLFILSLIFFAYNFIGEWIPGALGHNGFSLKRVLISQFWGTQGIFGISTGISATYIFLFSVFASFLKYSGFSDFLNELSLSLVGHRRGGPAKVAVLASSFMGMINGSAVANVATTGTITIPMMIKAGYKKEFAAAVEAASSTGGQFCPPIMGAVGFVMAEFLNVSYVTVMLAAVIPSVLYYTGILVSVHLEAKKLGLPGISRKNVSDVLTVLKRRGFLIIPVFVLIGSMLSGFSPLLSCSVSLVTTVIVSWLKKDTSMSFFKIFRACVEGAKNALSVGVSCMIIGVIICTVTLTGVALNSGYLILRLIPHNNIYLIGFFVMIISVVLGMGVPGVAAYVIIQAVSVPVLVSIGINPLSAHFFCLMYACLSNITPPVAISCYVASGIARSDQFKTALLSVRLALTGFIIPFFFLNNSVLLLSFDSSSVIHVITAFITAFMGIVSLSCASEGYLILKCTVIERLILVISSFLMLHISYVTDIFGICIFTLSVINHVCRKKVLGIK